MRIGINSKPLEEDLSDRISKVKDRLNLLFKYLGIEVVEVSATLKHKKMVSKKQKAEPKRKVGRPRKLTIKT